MTMPAYVMSAANAESFVAAETTLEPQALGPGAPPPGPPVDPPRRGGDDGGMEARIAKLEASVGHIESDIKELKDDVRALRADITAIRTTDFRLLYGSLIFGVLGLAGVMAHGFHWL